VDRIHVCPNSSQDQSCPAQEAKMNEAVDRVNTWEVRHRPDGGYGVYDDHGLIAGPFGTRTEALDAAMQLTRPAPEPVARRTRDRADV
jgi:hypothetical protein